MQSSETTRRHRIRRKVTWRAAGVGARTVGAQVERSPRAGVGLRSQWRQQETGPRTPTRTADRPVSAAVQRRTGVDGTQQA